MDPMNTQSPDMSHAPTSKVHTWMLILLTWIAVLSLVAVALLLTKNSSNGLSSSEIAAACQNGTINGITTNLTRISEACADEKDLGAASTSPTGASFDGTSSEGTLPGLTLPANWTASWNVGPFSEGLLAEFHAVKGIYQTCDACGGLNNPPEFRMTTWVAAKSELMNPEDVKAYYIEQSKADDAEYTNISVTSTAVSGGTLVSIDGTRNIQAAGARNGNFHILKFVNATKYIEIIFDEYGASNEEWLTVKNSIDWSSVK